VYNTEVLEINPIWKRNVFTEALTEFPMNRRKPHNQRRDDLPTSKIEE
jgi:hypothetical protein